LRLHLARWRVGVAQRSRRARSLTELWERRVRVVQREPGASSQKALVSALAANSATALAGPVAAGHLEVARRVAEGAPAGVTMEPAALQFGLAFESLEEHVAEIWIDARWRSHPAVDAIGEVLRSASFTSQLRLVGGYDMTGCGSRNER
jgi:molybdate-binding protein